MSTTGTLSEHSSIHHDISELHAHTVLKLNYHAVRSLPSRYATYLTKQPWPFTLSQYNVESSLVQAKQ